MVKQETDKGAFFKKELIDELRFVAKAMKNENSLEKKIYYFSAAYGITQRTYRYAFSGDVLLADVVLTNSHNLLNERVIQLKSNVSAVNSETLKTALLHIQDDLISLADDFESGNDIKNSLESILTAAYSTSGNGNYLLERGLLKL